MIAFGLTVIVDLVGSLLVWNWESGIKGSDIHGFRDSLFFTTVQVLTVSSSLKNPLTGIGRVVDVVLELWAIGVVTAVAGSFSTCSPAGTHSFCGSPSSPAKDLHDLLGQDPRTASTA